jgi:cytochrome c-type biogenesis protein CcsB
MALAILRVAAAGYVVAALIGLLAVLRPREGLDVRVRQAFLAGVVLHALAIIARGSDISLVGIYDGLSLFTCLAGIVALGVAWRGVPQVALLATPPLALLAVIAAIGGPEGRLEGASSPWLGIHIGLAIMGDAAIAIAGVVSMIYLLQESRLKGAKRVKGKRAPRTKAGLASLPALEVLDGVSARLIKWGFPLMTLGVISGALYGKQVWGHYWAWDPRLTVSLLVWILYAVMLHARFAVGWRGRKAAILTVLGVIAILLAFVGFGLAGVGVHAKDYVS